MENAGDIAANRPRCFSIVSFRAGQGKDMFANPSSSAVPAQPFAPELIVVPEALALAGGPANAPERGPESQTQLTSDFASLKPQVSGESSDAELVLAACTGDPRAASVIWRRYSSQVRTKVHRWIGLQDIDDIVQEVFSRLFTQLPRMREPSALRGFLIGITLRVAFTELRRRRRCRLRLTATGELPELCESFGDKGPDREALWRFEAILAALSAPSRRVFVLRYVEKLELMDVAAAMDISLPTVKRHLARAAGHVAAMVEREPALADYVQGTNPKMIAEFRCRPSSP
jgi:RNA polymerase sigma-70 factor (ECF subfamily)